MLKILYSLKTRKVMGWVHLMWKYAHKKMKYVYEIMSRVKLEEYEKKYKIDAEWIEAENFLIKYKIRALKFIVLLLNCTQGPPNLGVGAGPGLGPPPGSASALSTLIFFPKLKHKIDRYHWCINTVNLVFHDTHFCQICQIYHI